MKLKKKNHYHETYSFCLSTNCTDHLSSARNPACFVKELILQLEATEMLKQGVAREDCAIERPIFGKVVRLESKQPKSGGFNEQGKR